MSTKCKNNNHIHKLTNFPYSKMTVRAEVCMAGLYQGKFDLLTQFYQGSPETITETLHQSSILFFSQINVNGKTVKIKILN